MSTVDIVIKRLWEKALYRASEMGFAPDCKEHVKHLVKVAAQRLESEGLLSDQEKLAIAEESIERFVSEMILEARRRGYNELHEDTFFAAMRGLCPLWPIC